MMDKFKAAHILACILDGQPQVLESDLKTLLEDEVAYYNSFISKIQDTKSDCEAFRSVRLPLHPRLTDYLMLRLTTLPRFGYINRMMVCSIGKMLQVILSLKFSHVEQHP